MVLSSADSVIGRSKDFGRSFISIITYKEEKFVILFALDRPFIQEGFKLFIITLRPIGAGHNLLHAYEVVARFMHCWFLFKPTNNTKVFQARLSTQRKDRHHQSLKKFSLSTVNNGLYVQFTWTHDLCSYATNLHWRPTS